MRVLLKEDKRPHESPPPSSPLKLAQEMNTFLMLTHCCLSDLFLPLQLYIHLYHQL